MKINPKGNLAGLLGNDLDVGSAAEKKAQEAKQRDPNGGKSDQVDVGLSQFISQALDPNVMAAERRKKVERLKELVQAGKYQTPSSEELAQKVGEELVFEILGSSES